MPARGGRCKSLVAFPGPPRYLAGMDITPDQARVLRDAVRSRMGYLHGVKVRMYQLGVGPGDGLYDLFDQAGQSLCRLADELHGRAIGDCSRRPWELGDGSAGAAGP